MVKEFDGKCPVLAPGVWMAENATVVGDVILGAGVSLWYGAVVRGDTNTVRIGENTNIQDNVVVHPGRTHPVTLGANITVGHGAIVHGCTVEDGALIGMGAILLNDCVVGAEAMIAAGSLVPQGKVIPPRMLAMGSPAKVVRPLREEELAAQRRSAEDYLHIATTQLLAAEGRA